MLIVAVDFNTILFPVFGSSVYDFPFESYIVFGKSIPDVAFGGVFRVFSLLQFLNISFAPAGISIYSPSM